MAGIILKGSYFVPKRRPSRGQMAEFPLCRSRSATAQGFDVCYTYVEPDWTLSYRLSLTLLGLGAFVRGLSGVEEYASAFSRQKPLDVRCVLRMYFSKKGANPQLADLDLTHSFRRSYFANLQPFLPPAIQRPARPAIFRSLLGASGSNRGRQCPRRGGLVRSGEWQHSGGDRVAAPPLGR